MESLQTRVTNILKSPATEWPVIATESTDVGQLYREYIIPLSAIPVVATFIGWSLIGFGFFSRSITAGLSLMVVSFVLGLISAYVCAVIIEWLAPKFKSSGSRLDALKLVAYASTPMWIAGVLNILPALAVLILFATLYGIYLFYLGLPVLLKTPSDQVVPFMIVAAIVIVVVSMVMMSVAAALTLGSALTMM